MGEQDLLTEITARDVSTPRLQTHLLESGAEDRVPVLFVHGNVASSRFFEETLAVLQPPYRGLAPDLRGFGKSETKPVDATRGLRDFSDDLHALVMTLGYGNERKVHLVGWSMGGGIVMQYTIDHPAEVASLTLVNPVPPYGMGGTKDTAGTPCWPDFAGGRGLPSLEFIRFLKQGLGDDPADPNNPSSPRNVMNRTYFKPPFRAAAEREEVLLSAVLSTKVGDENYPGDRTSSPNWPKVAPGTWGVLNAISPLYCDLSAFAEIRPKPPVLWVRGVDDKVVSENTLLDFGRLGRLGIVPGWPGEKVYPPQPMIAQTRAVLDRYQVQSGRYREAAIPDCGHSPHIEKPEEFQRKLFDFLDEQSKV